MGKCLSVEDSNTQEGYGEQCFSHVFVFPVQRGKTVFGRKGLRTQMKPFSPAPAAKSSDEAVGVLGGNETPGTMTSALL